MPHVVGVIGCTLPPLSNVARKEVRNLIQYRVDRGLAVTFDFQSSPADIALITLDAEVGPWVANTCMKYSELKVAVMHPRSARREGFYRFHGEEKCNYYKNKAWRVLESNDSQYKKGFELADGRTHYCDTIARIIARNLCVIENSDRVIHLSNDKSFTSRITQELIEKYCAEGKLTSYS